MPSVNDTNKKHYYCEKCNRTLLGSEFYTSNNLEKYPNDGKLTQCKKCITMHVDNWNPDTFLWIIQEVDVPWLPDAWNNLMKSYAKDPAKVTGTTILGRYIGKMRLKPYTDYRWKDSKFLKEMNDNKLEMTMKANGYDAQQIAEALNRQDYAVPTEPIAIPVYEAEKDDLPQPPQPSTSTSDYFDTQNDIDISSTLDLTDEEKLQLRLKWGKSYKPEEWVALEQLYKDMMDSYDIQQAGHIDTLKLICKTSLKSNQLLDIGDVEGAQKMVKMYEALMKSGKFTAAQNKAEKGEFVDSVGEIVALCEKEGFIPRYYTDGPKDRVDETLLDLKNYTRTLVTEEMNLGNLIENAVKEMVKEENKAEDEDIDDDTLTMEELEAMQDEDFVEYNEFVEGEQADDDATLAEFMNESEDS